MTKEEILKNVQQLINSSENKEQVKNWILEEIDEMQKPSGITGYIDVRLEDTTLKGVVGNVNINLPSLKFSGVGSVNTKVKSKKDVNTFFKEWMLKPLVGVSVKELFEFIKSSLLG